jgi:hypothetical protein
VREAIRGRFAQCGLELHPEKTRSVYCKDGDRPGSYEHIMIAGRKPMKYFPQRFFARRGWKV